MSNRWATACLLIVSGCLMVPSSADGQIVLQQPVFGVFAIRTTVTVPDGGTMRLGGVSGYSSGSVSRGVPGLANIPGVNRGFSNRATGSHSAGGQVTVSAQVISLREMENAVLDEAELRQAARRAADPNGTLSVQQKADQISKNIGRTQRR